VDQVLGQMLRQAVWERLDMLDELASSADNGSLLSVARSELPRLTHGWRALLASHAPDPRGRCPECSSRWRPRALCSVWGAAHEHLVHTEGGSGSSGSVPSLSGSLSGARRAVLQMRNPTSLLPAGTVVAR
jgi:hypothetical protein